MFAKNLINPHAPYWDVDTTIETLHGLFAQHETSKIAAVQGGHFVGFAEQGTEKALHLAMRATAGTWVFDYQHLYEVTKTCVNNVLSPVAVVDDKDAYMGTILVEDIVCAIAKVLSLEEAGIVMVLTMDKRNCSLQEIMYLLDSEAVRLWNLHISQAEGSKHALQVTLRLHPTEQIHWLVATFERFGYTVTTYKRPSDDHTKERRNFEVLMRYLNI